MKGLYKLIFSSLVSFLVVLAMAACESAVAEDGTTLATPAKLDTGLPWQADLGNGTYRNPVLYADYSDPDVVAAGDDFYMTSSSFNDAPGLPVLHSKDLVNWTLLGYALPKLVPEDVFAIPQHGNGVWAPNIRYHDGKVWIFYPDPDFGIYMIRSDDPKTGVWSEPKLILAGKGLIDPTPLWDDDGRAWLLHAWAKSRSGKNNILTLHRMSPDGAEVAEQGKVIIDGHKLPGYSTIEGPKFYKRDGYYYIFAPAGGVPVGWQAVFRSKNIEGPYEYRTVMEQGDTLVNGPHQGAWVQTPAGEDWFLHFQSKLAYGRIVHLQPMKWVDDWPVIGSDPDGDGVGNPVSVYRKPEVGQGGPGLRRDDESHLRRDDVNLITAPPATDEFDRPDLGKQWQWNANMGDGWYSLIEREGYLRLYAQRPPDPETLNLWMMPSLLLQKIPAPSFIVETVLDIPADASAMSAGLLMFGEDYAWIGLKKDAGSGEVRLGYASCADARTDCTEDFKTEKVITSNKVTLRMTVTEGGGTVFSYLDDNGRFKAIGELFQARPGRWVGAKVGLFARLEGEPGDDTDAFVDFRYFRFLKPSAPTSN